MGGPVEASAVKPTDRTLIPRCVAETGHAIVGTAAPVDATEFHRALLVSRLAPEEQGDEQAFKRRSTVRDPVTHTTIRWHRQSIRIARRSASRQAARFIPQNRGGPRRSGQLHPSGSSTGQGSGAATAGGFTVRAGVAARRRAGLSDAKDTLCEDAFDDGFAGRDRLAGNQEALRLPDTPTGWESHCGVLGHRPPRPLESDRGGSWESIRRVSAIR